MKRITIILLLFFTAVFSLKSFAQTDKEQIKITIGNYFDGWATSDTAKISIAMHASCRLKFYRDSTFTNMDKNAYLARFKAPKQRDADIKTKILSMDITGNIAQAKTEIETAKAVFIDYFNLIRTNEGWFIVDKIATRTDKK
jgi:aldose sugar dehydrogenase